MRSVHSVVKWIEHRSPNHSNRFDHRLHRYEPDKKTDQLGGARFVVPGLRIGILTTEFTECTEWGDSSSRSFRTVLTTDYTDSTDTSRVEKRKARNPVTLACVFYPVFICVICG